MSASVYLADLRYNYSGVVANDCMPLGVAYMKAVMDRDLPEVRSRLFVYPDRLSHAIKTAPPAVLMLTNYCWNERLSLHMARLAKRVRPGTLTVLGGPNIPIEDERQLDYMRAHPEIDVYVRGEGDFLAAEIVKLLPRRRRVAAAVQRERGAVQRSATHRRHGPSERACGRATRRSTKSRRRGLRAFRTSSSTASWPASSRPTAGARSRAHSASRAPTGTRRCTTSTRSASRRRSSTSRDGSPSSARRRAPCGSPTRTTACSSATSSLGAHRRDAEDVRVSDVHRRDDREESAGAHHPVGREGRRRAAGVPGRAVSRRQRAPAHQTAEHPAQGVRADARADARPRTPLELRPHSRAAWRDASRRT